MMLPDVFLRNSTAQAGGFSVFFFIVYVTVVVLRNIQPQYLYQYLYLYLNGCVGSRSSFPVSWHVEFGLFL